MPGHFYKRGAIWWAWFYAPTGERVRFSTKMLDKRAAESVLREEERRAAAPPDAAENAPAHTLAQALTYLVRFGCSDAAPGTVRMHSQKGGHLTRLFGSIDINALTRDDTQSYIEARIDEGAAKETVRKELCTLRRALEIAHERRLLTREPEGLIPRFRTRYQPRDRYLTTEQVPALLRVLPASTDVAPRCCVHRRTRIRSGKSPMGRHRLADADDPHSGHEDRRIISSDPAARESRERPPERRSHRRAHRRRLAERSQRPRRRLPSREGPDHHPERSPPDVRQLAEAARRRQRHRRALLGTDAPSDLRTI